MFKFSEKETSLTHEVVCRLDESLVWTQVLQFSDFGNPEVKAIERKVCLLLEPRSCIEICYRKNSSYNGEIALLD